MRETLKLLLPFVVWLLIFWDFVSGKITLNIDSFGYYAVLKYYFNNLLNGVIPLWDPFLWLGGPFVYIVIIGVLNPLSYLVILLKLFGLNYYSAILAYMVFTYFLGLAGFYCLARFLLRDGLLAFLAYLLLLFSGLGTAVFNQMNMLLIFVPAVWFFFFLFCFAQTGKKSCFLGLTLCLMCLVTSYPPFHLLTVFLAYLLVCGVLYFAHLKEFFIQLKNFVRNNTRIFFVCFVALGIVGLPAFLSGLTGLSHEIVTPARHCEHLNARQCVDDTLTGDAAMTYSEATSGVLGWRMSFWSLFSHLDKVNYSQDGWFYLPVFVFLILFVASFTFLDRKKLAVMAIAFIIFLISLGDATPVYPFLFKNVPYFQYFRNLFYFMAFLLPLAVLLGVMQLQSIMQSYREYPQAKREKILVTIFILHGVFFLFLLWRGNVVMSSFVTVFGSLLFFCLYFGGYLEHKKFYIAFGLIALCLIQPLEVFRAYKSNAATNQCSVYAKHVSPKFHYLRVDSPPENDFCRAFRQVPKYREFGNLAAMEDSLQLIGFPGSAIRWVFLLLHRMDPGVLRDYVKDKFILYDRVEALGDEKEDIAILSDAFRKQKNVAYISQEVLSEAGENFTDSISEKYAVAGNSNEFQVTHFDVNSIALRTHFSKKKFLVYNDAYNSHWTVLINGVPGRIYRANLAFKGIWLPEGENTVQMMFDPPGGRWVYVFVTLVFFCFFCYTLLSLIQQKPEMKK